MRQPRVRVRLGGGAGAGAGTGALKNVHLEAVTGVASWARGERGDTAAKEKGGSRVLVSAGQDGFIKLWDLAVQ